MRGCFGCELWGFRSFSYETGSFRLIGPRFNDQFDTLNTFKKKPHSSLRNEVFDWLRI
jgi:hypothetical protein